MKKIIFIMTGLLLVLSLFSCSSKKTVKTKKPFSYDNDFTLEVIVPDTSSNIKTKADKINKKLTAVELTKLMGNGINLGNTMEAYRGWFHSTKLNAESYERAWGQPETTAEMFVAYKEAGFDTVRIPVAWTNMMDYENGDYVISYEYLDRVETVVNYALDADLYVIINDHWDGQWWGMFGSENMETRHNAVMLYKSMWTQIATRFKNYSDKLIFEGANEELGNRLNDDTVFSAGAKGVLTETHLFQAVNEINQCFVDVVRSTGGNNYYRFLLIPGFDTDIRQTVDVRFEMPEDSAKNKLLVSVHYYTPSTFCILNQDADWGKNKEDWGTQDDYGVMNRNLAQMQKFVEQGYGVVIGEYGVSMKKDGDKKDGTEKWMRNLVEKSEEYNYCPILWDCNSFFKKTGTLGFQDPELAAIYKK